MNGAHQTSEVNARPASQMTTSLDREALCATLCKIFRLSGPFATKWRHFSTNLQHFATYLRRVAAVHCNSMTNIGLSLFCSFVDGTLTCLSYFRHILPHLLSMLSFLVTYRHSSSYVITSCHIPSYFCRQLSHFVTCCHRLSHVGICSSKL